MSYCPVICEQMLIPDGREEGKEPIIQSNCAEEGQDDQNVASDGLDFGTRSVYGPMPPSYIKETFLIHDTSCRVKCQI